MFQNLLFAQAPAAPAGSFIVQMFPFLLIFGVFYFLLIRPQQKKQRDHQAMVDGIKKGDAVLTSGGIYGVITAVKEKSFGLKIADNVKVEITRNSITALVKSKEGSSEE